MTSRASTFATIIFVLPVVVACGSAAADTPESTSTTAGSTEAGTGTVTLYSGRTEELVGPLLDRFEEGTGIDVEVRYGSSPEMAATLLTEGENSPADLFYAQDPASLGSVAHLTAHLPESVLALVPEQYRDPDGTWVGITVRSRVLAYNPELIAEAELPASYKDLVRPEWSGLVGVAPTNGSFVAFVSAIILTEGEDAAREWLEGIAANDPITFDGNAPIAAAVDAGDVSVGLINHYYLRELAAEQGEVTAENHFFGQADAGSLVMPSGISLLATAAHRDGALELIEFLLSDESQAYFAQTNFEYPVVEGAPAPEGVPALETLVSPSVDATEMASVLDLATDLIAEAGLV